MPQPQKEINPPVVLVTGANGYIASQLIPRLLTRGLTVRCLVRNPSSLRGRDWLPQVQVFQGDLSKPDTYQSALKGVSTIYYLVHSMASGGQRYTAQDLTSAEQFSQAAKQAGVGHIIYLGGLADPQTSIAPHMRSRIQTGQALISSNIPVTEFRAGVIVGPGSISFEMIRFITEQFPLIICPRWMSNLAQPIAIQNIVDYLLAALGGDPDDCRPFEIGGSQVLTYAETMLTYAHLRGLHRRVLILPFSPAWLLATLMPPLTSVPASITHPLVEGLKSDSLVRDPSSLEVFPDIHPLDYTQAVQASLARLHPSQVEPVWRQNLHRQFSLKHAGFCILGRRIPLKGSAPPLQALLDALTRSANWQPDLAGSSPRANQFLLRWTKPLPGSLWLELRQEADVLCLTLLFAPRGLPGFLAWYLGDLRVWSWFLVRKARQVVKNISFTEA